MRIREAGTRELTAVGGRRLRWAIAAGLIALLAVAAYMFWPRGTDEQSAKQPRPALNVTVAKPERVTWPVTIEASGAVTPWEEASVGTQIGSYQLIDVRVNVGDQVRRGQVLARLNPALLRAEEAQLAARDAQARANDARARGLQSVGGISEQEALQFATEAKTAAALLAAKRLELEYTAIRAPDDGVITARTATVGAVVPAGQELFRLIRKNRLEWRGELTATQLASIAKGQQVALRLADGTGAKGVVRETAPSLDAQSRVAIVYADLAPGSRARAGMYVAGRIAVGERSALIVPAECVIVRDGRNYVAEAVAAGATTRVTFRAVEPGRRNGDLIEILRGIAGGARLVRRGGAFLNDGDVVRIVVPDGMNR
jgi:RND family efflux transporter MFP subunit